MSTVPNSSTNDMTAFITVAGDRRVYLCCGRVDDEVHRNFCEHYRPTEESSSVAEGDLREFARRVAGLGFAIDPDGDQAYLTERLNTLLAEGVTPTPPESEWVPAPACPAWCTGEHQGDEVVPEVRECSSGAAYLEDANGRPIVVEVARVFDRITGRFSRAPHVRIEDVELTARGARALVRELLDLAELIDG